MQKYKRHFTQRPPTAGRGNQSKCDAQTVAGGGVDYLPGYHMSAPADGSPGARGVHDAAHVEKQPVVH